MKKYLILVFLSSILLSCNNVRCENTQKELHKMMGKWYKKKIVFPTDMQILAGDISVERTFLNQPKLTNYTIVHFFTADCDKCVNELEMIQKSLNKTSKNRKINYVFIASAPTKVYVMDAIKKTKFPYPIYYEKEYYSFKTINGLPTKDDLYDTMILNSKQEVILFGAFYSNKKAKQLYENVIECSL